VAEKDLHIGIPSQRFRPINLQPVRPLRTDGPQGFFECLIGFRYGYALPLAVLSALLANRVEFFHRLSAARPVRLLLKRV
jgi:hypothetical protein